MGNADRQLVLWIVGRSVENLCGKLWSDCLQKGFFERQKIHEATHVRSHTFRNFDSIHIGQQPVWITYGRAYAKRRLALPASCQPFSHHRAWLRLLSSLSRDPASYQVIKRVASRSCDKKQDEDHQIGEGEFASRCYGASVSDEKGDPHREDHRLKRKSGQQPQDDGCGRMKSHQRRWRGERVRSPHSERVGKSSDISSNDISFCQPCSQQCGKYRASHQEE